MKEMPREPWFLIENNSQTMFIFRTLRELKEFARENGLHIKKSPTYPRAYYTESYVILPTGYKD